jgi:SAM-dependent methyltransferase
MRLFRKAIARLRRAWYGSSYTREKWTRDERLAYLEEVVEYLRFESSRQAMLLRHVAAPIVAELPAVRRTKESFDFQWAAIPSGASMLDSPQFRAQATALVCDFTGLPAEWFRGKRVIDVGCGTGRYSWALCELGAKVLSLDQSEHGLRQTAAACRAYASHEVLRVDLLKPLPGVEPADLVWCFGVLHHTGSTYDAFRHVVPLVRPDGGFLYMMIYGEPRASVLDDFAEINEYERWRRRTANMALPAKLEAIREGMRNAEFRMRGEEHVHGYFDAIAPPINDLHSFQEIESWLLDVGFADINRTLDARNLHVIARRVPEAGA